jgi:broad specificity phosphatase PhoE
MPPAHVFIVRHGERMDHINPDFGKTYPRPHDSPLTPNGVAMAETLGAYLVQHYHITPADTVVLTSPLTRCVQTSNGIVNGALRAVGDGTQSIPIYLEPAIMEGAYWIFRDMQQNPSVVDPCTGAFHCPDPVYYSAPHHHASTSPYVELTNPFPLYSAPHFVIEGNQLVDHSFPERCAKGAKQLLSVSELDGKTVILVAHGETVLRAMYALTDTDVSAVVNGPPYTAFVHLTCGASGAATPMVADSLTFTTPHLPEVPKES